MWLSREFLRWTPSYHSGWKPDPARAHRPHEIFRHAESLLRAAASELSIADAVLNLKRAINARLQHLDELYRLSAAFPRGTGVMGRLEAVGLARPFLVGQLFELRNNIEHQDAPPPSLDRCTELLDVTWYFLRTTDYACRTVPQGVCFTCNSGKEEREPPLWLTASEVSAGSRTIRVHGWVTVALLSDQETPNSLHLMVRTMREKRAAPPDESDPIAKIASLQNAARQDDERWLDAHVEMASDVHRSVFRALFDVL